MEPACINMKYLTLTCLFLLTSCATFNEAIDPNDSTLGYSETKNDKGGDSSC